MSSHSEVETFLASDFDEISNRISCVNVIVDDQSSLVGANASCLERFRAQLFVFVGDHVYAKRKLVDIGTLATEVEDSNLGIRYTTVEARLGVWLRMSVCHSRLVFKSRTLFLQ